VGESEGAKKLLQGGVSGEGVLMKKGATAKRKAGEKNLVAKKIREKPGRRAKVEGAGRGTS